MKEDIIHDSDIPHVVICLESETGRKVDVAHGTIHMRDDGGVDIDGKLDPRIQGAENRSVRHTIALVVSHLVIELEGIRLHRADDGQKGESK